VSLLDRLGLSRHLSDADLAEVWTDASLAAETRGAAGARSHLLDCAQCRTRYTEFTSWLDGVRADARADADEAFPPERLAAQQAQILRRLETIGRPARVIAFPRFTGPVSAGHPGRQRWIAAAAAAGLVVGIGLGRLVDFHRPLGEPDGFPSGPQIARTSQPDRPGGIQPVSVSLNDEVLLYDRERFSATAVPIPAPLQHINAITPGARDFEPR
jgi:hypothetical protein